MESFLRQSRQLHQQVRSLMASHGPIHELIEGFDFAVYVKAVDGRILITNQSYESIFSGRQSSVGRMSASVLHATILSVSRASDDLIIAGCGDLCFSHVGRDGLGRKLKFETFKGSLLGEGHSQWAILGISQLLEASEGDLSLRIFPISESWKIFSTFTEREKNVAVMISKGKRVKEIAASVDVSEKTVDNTRASILEKLLLDQPADLIKLMVRLQDNGFADFGL